MLDILYAGLETDDWRACTESSENESVKATVGEGFAKLLLLGEKYPNLPASFYPFVLGKLIALYFSEESKEQLRFKQCLSVFFEHYASLLEKHKGYISKAFVPLIRSLWPGIDRNSKSSSYVVSNQRKRAVLASKFILQMMQTPLYKKETRHEPESQVNKSPEDSIQPPIDCTEEGLAIRIAIEMVSFKGKKTAAEKAYVAALCKILVLLNLKPSEQNLIKLMKKLLCRVAESVCSEKELLKDVKPMLEHLNSLDACPSEELSQDEANSIFEALGVSYDLDITAPATVPQTPAPCSTRPARSRRRARIAETSSDEEEEVASPPLSAMPAPNTLMTRSHRASKAAALAKITASRMRRSDADEDIEEEEEDVVSSDVTAEDSDD
ncbi:hypothetical protein AALP_AA6G355200 [Arabis alpina]|uniref:Nuclear condensin complex subunit 3 C-terminal domain-containing protein n=1 Tax=Arabis alpina TaxID=50452 RepID=A0A087GTT4_ARAAL|nr:hypothetical protein AALP_AA6G355200 [Arabis alpina]